MTEKKKTKAALSSIEASWKTALQEELDSPQFHSLENFLEQEKRDHLVYPTDNNIFRAFNLTPVDHVKVVILGQDPYHGHGQAHGLAFSVPDGVPIPPSLSNIFKELHRDLGIPIPYSGSLLQWAERGVLLLNATLTVRAHQPTSHQGKGWEFFTHAVIRYLSESRQHLVFLLWGASAGQKASLIDHGKHLVLIAPHPSPLSAYRGFFGCAHFSKTNAYLIQNNFSPIDWNPVMSVNH